ncbi:MAG: hypothetical protein A2516_10135 [Alphaproteobacteria bacterium RIFOXYD12_FULL_60_8]|nr:MAG: hypothetical protein A2516_10135 [Alphaproteobacteria bacterium RIFOXYD12_FULL_60_8]
MVRYDFSSLLQEPDPAFKREVLDDYRLLLAQASEAAEDEAAVQVFQTAMQRFAASVYTIAKDLDLEAEEIGLISAYTLGMLSGASCGKESAKTVGELKVVFAEALDVAYGHKEQSVGLVADLVIDGLSLRPGRRPSSPWKLNKP